MVSVACFCVGKELLIGKTVNSNAYWLGSRMFGIGMMLDRVLVVTDSLKDISEGLHALLAPKPDFIIVVGGLGPTPDDMTLKGVALALGRKIRLDRTAISMMKEHYATMGRTFELTPARRKMAMLPEGSIPLLNPVGTAPGVRLETSGTVIFCLPGVPREMKAIYRTSIHAEIREKVGRLYTAKVVMHLSGIYESTLAPLISQALKAHPYSYVKSHPKGVVKGRSSVELDLVSISTRRKEAEDECDDLSKFFAEGIAAAGGTITSRLVSTVGR